MKIPPYTLHEAEDLCSSFKHLLSKAYDIASPDLAQIEYLVVTPFDEEGKNKFLFYFNLVQDNQSVLNEVGKGLLFDVLVIARAKEDLNQLFHQSLYSWMQKNNPTPERSKIAEALLASFKTPKPLEQTNLN